MRLEACDPVGCKKARENEGVPLGRNYSKYQEKETGFNPTWRAGGLRAKLHVDRCTAGSSCWERWTVINVKMPQGE